MFLWKFPTGIYIHYYSLSKYMLLLLVVSFFTYWKLRFKYYSWWSMKCLAQIFYLLNYFNKSPLIAVEFKFIKVFIFIKYSPQFYSVNFYLYTICLISLIYIRSIYTISVIRCSSINDSDTYESSKSSKNYTLFYFSLYMFLLNSL